MRKSNSNCIFKSVFSSFSSNQPYATRPTHHWGMRTCDILILRRLSVYLRFDGCCVYLHKYTCKHINTYTHTHTITHTYIHTYILNHHILMCSQLSIPWFKKTYIFNQLHVSLLMSRCRLALDINRSTCEVYYSVRLIHGALLYILFSVVLQWYVVSLLYIVLLLICTAWRVK
jgi:hypothetical protein